MAGEDVPLIVVDRFPLSSLHLLKIDVEGMEAEVLLGAKQTIARHRPILHVENDRREKSPALIGLILELGYDLNWDLPPLFNPSNFASCPDNIFSRIISINLLCIPKELNLPAPGSRRVIGPSDWWQLPA